MGAAGARTLAMLATVTPAAFVARGNRKPHSSHSSSPRCWVAEADERRAGVCFCGLHQAYQRAVRTTGPSEVTATVCSACAPREPSRLRKVHPSRSV